MLGDKDAMATVAVKDFAAAKAFYGGKLGLDARQVDDETGVATYRSGRTSIVVYRSAYAGTNQATSVTWGVGPEFDDIVAALQRAGVSFEHYDLPGMRLEGDAHVVGASALRGSRTRTATSCTSTTCNGGVGMRSTIPPDLGLSAGRLPSCT